MKKVLVIAGTRPEAVKLAPVVHELRRWPEDFVVHLCSSGQHQTMLEQTLADFDLRPDSSLKVMTGNQTLSGLSARLFAEVDNVLDVLSPDVVIVQGDTTTVQVSALCAFYRRIPVGHVEAGLRTWNLGSPFPEELNRRVVGLAARWHYAPTELARQNLLAERIRSEDVLVTGNTVIDALYMTLDDVRRHPPLLPPRIEAALAQEGPVILVTGHRRESFGDGFMRICAALKRIAVVLPHVRIIYPVHLNPNVHAPVSEMLGDVPNIYLEDPFPYKAFVRLMDASTLILTDSGGIQEEGPSLNKPVLIMRDTTERPEGIEAGVNLLVGTDTQRIFDEVAGLVCNPEHIAKMQETANPYGDGNAAQRIAAHLRMQ